MPDATLAPAAREPEGSRAAPVRDRGAMVRFGNGKRVHTPANRLGGRRRYRNLVRRMAAPLGNWCDLPEATQQLVLEVVSLTVQREDLDRRVELGQPVDPVVYATVRNALARARQDLAAAAPKPREPTLADLLATMAQKLDAA